MIPMKGKNRSGWFCLLLLQVAVINGSSFVNGAGHEIIVIERTLGGAYVATSEQHYAFTHPDLAELSWRSVSVRDNQVFIYRDDNSTSLKRWDKLEESSRDLISDLRSEFIANMAGLTLADSHRPPPPKSDRPTSNSGGGGGGRYDTSEPQPRPSSTGAYPPPVMPPPAYGSYQPMLQARALVLGRKYRKKAKKSNRQPPGGGGKKYTNSKNNNEDDEEEDNHSEDERLLSSGGGGGGGFNYYNVHQTDLRKKLTGDVYHFDMRGNILDVFSSTVSIKSSSQGASVLYRDKRFFSYSTPTLPLSLHRLFVQGEFAFFVYKNSNVLVKSVNLLSPKELKLLGRARALVDRLCQWQSPPPGFVFALPAESTKREQSLPVGNFTEGSNNSDDTSSGETE